MHTFFEQTLFFWRLTPNDNCNALVATFYMTFNTAVRLGIVYAGIRVILSALEHGAF